MPREEEEHGEGEGEEWEDERMEEMKARIARKDYNPLETMMSVFQQSSSSAKIELKQRLPDGSYQPAPSGTLEAIGSQAKLAATANIIANMTREEKTRWAVEKRNEGNQFYLRKEFENAIQIYLEVYLSLPPSYLPPASLPLHISDLTPSSLCDSNSVSQQQSSVERRVQNTPHSNPLETFKRL